MEAGMTEAWRIADLIHAAAEARGYNLRGGEFERLIPEILEAEMTYRMPDPALYRHDKPELHGQRGRVLAARLRRRLSGIVGGLGILASLVVILAVETGIVSITSAVQWSVYVVGVMLLYFFVAVVTDLSREWRQRGQR